MKYYLVSKGNELSIKPCKNETAPQMGLESTTFQLILHNSSQDLMKLKFFMSQNITEGSQ